MLLAILLLVGALVTVLYLVEIYTFEDVDGSFITERTCHYNERVTAPQNPTKEGYTFDGWYIGETEFDFGTQITSNITLTAKWTENAGDEGDNGNGGATPPPADDNNDETPPSGNVNEDNGGTEEEELSCGGSIAIGTIVPSMIAILGAGLIIKAKKKD